MNAITKVSRKSRSKIELIERAHSTPINDLLLRLYAQGLNQHEIADYLGVSQSTISQYTKSAGIKVQIVRTIEGAQS